MHGLDKPGVFTTVSFLMCIQQYETSCQSQNHQYRDDACTLINVYEYASAKKEDKHPDEHQADGVVPSHGECVSLPLLALPHANPRMRLHRLLERLPLRLSHQRYAYVAPIHHRSLSV